MGNKKLRKPFPYARVARLWNNGRTIGEIADRIGRVEKGKDDPYHAVRNFLRIMHRVHFFPLTDQVEARTRFDGTTATISTSRA